MSNDKIYGIKPEVAATAHIGEAEYHKLYEYSIKNPELFWGQQAERFLEWMEPWQKVTEYDFSTANIRWFIGAKLNVSFNCLDRHLEKRGEQTAILWESDDPNINRQITYRELHRLVCRFANALKAKGAGKGDRICIY